MLDGMQGLLLTGGEDVSPTHYHEAAHPTVSGIHDERDAFELALVLAARERRLPVLAICRGIQVANVALGGTLIQDIPSQIPNAVQHDGNWPRDERVHDVDVTPHSHLANALGTEHLRTNSFHHQAVRNIAAGLTPVAHTADGIIEAAEWTADDWWFLAVQWHPEELTNSTDPWDRNLFRAFARHLNP
jgi:putative glutamine amidotransferase